MCIVEHSRSCLKKNKQTAIKVFEQNDIILMTETWLGEEALVQVNGRISFSPGM